MALAVKKLSAQRPTTLVKPKIVSVAQPLKKTTMLDVFDIPVANLVESKENPNEQDEATFDQLVEVIRTTGFDEPIKVVPLVGQPGKYVVYSGHHRLKAAKVLKFAAVPCVIKEGWSEDARKIALIRENKMRGNLDPAKFTELWNDLAKRHDASVLKLQTGFTKDAAFKAVYKNIEKQLNPAQKAKLAEAKETITSIDGLSSVLNGIFKEHGSQLDNGFIVFSYGGKNHMYVESDGQLNKMLEKVQIAAQNKGALMSDVFKTMLTNLDLSKIKKSDKVEARKQVRLGKNK